MSTITVVDSNGGMHRFENVDGVKMRAGDVEVVVDSEDGKRVTVGVFAAGHWSSWRRLADSPSAPAHQTHVHFANTIIAGDDVDLAKIMDRGAGSKSRPPSGL